MELLAYCVGTQAYLILRARYRDVLPLEQRWTVVVAGAVGAWVGSKVLAWLELPHLFAYRIRNPIQLLAGKTIVGALAGGLIAVECTKRIARVEQRTGDLFAFPLAIGIAIGRIGCFLAGLQDDTYGSPSTLPWALDLGDGIPRHPVQLYETGFLLALAAWLWKSYSRPHADGAIFRRFMVTYFAWRLAVDFLKPGYAVGGLTVLQWTCVAVLVHYAFFDRLLHRDSARASDVLNTEAANA